jgi:uroporphyrinogen decarboxylase
MQRLICRTGRERMLAALDHRPTDRPPHFESMFELEHEAFGLRFPDRTSWAGMDAPAKAAAIGQCIEIYGRIISEFRWDALCVYWPWGDPDGVRAAKRAFGDQVLIGGMCGGAVWSLETIHDWEGFSVRLAEDRDGLQAEAERMCERSLATIDGLAAAGADFVYLPNDIADNRGPFLSKRHLDSLVWPRLTRLVARCHQHGMRAFLHSDGLVTPLVGNYIATGADLLQSLDPMAGVDIGEVRKLSRGRMALMGNVPCNLLQDTDEAAIAKAARYCLDACDDGQGGHVFSTSNTVFPGMPLASYRAMLAARDAWAANRPARAAAH